MEEDHPGEAIREAREHRGWSQEFLAAKVGTTQSTIDRIESGLTRKSRVLPDILSVLALSSDNEGRKSPATQLAGGFTRVSYVLPTELVQSITRYKNLINIPSEDEMVRRILQEYMMRRESVLDVVTRLVNKYRNLRSVREAAGIVLAGHPLVRSLQFEDDGSVQFIYQEDITIKIKSWGSVIVYKANGSHYKFWDNHLPEWVHACNKAEDNQQPDDVPF